MTIPIYKKGSKMDPDNYRGISLISCLYKLLTAILNKRLEHFCQEKKILPENALGFWKFAATNQIVGLGGQVKTYLTREITRVAMEEEFAELAVEELSVILQWESLDADEDELFYSLNKWIYYR